MTMDFQHIDEFGRYSFYIASSYAVSLLAVGYLLFSGWRRLKKAERALQALQKTGLEPLSGNIQHDS